MTCESVRRWLSDADADDAQALSVGEHLDGCAACREFAEADQRLVDPLPEQITPPVDLWQGIEARIHARRHVDVSFEGSAPRFDWQRTASIVTAIAAVLFLAVVLQSPTSAPVALAPVSGASNPVSDGIVMAAMERECHAAMAALMSPTAAPGQLDPQVMAMQAQVRAVDLAIADTRRAIEVDGGNARMMGSLAHLCRVRLRLTEQKLRLTRS